MISLAEQLAQLAPHLAEAAEEVVPDDMTADEAVAGALRRLVRGFEEFGDNLFRMDFYQVCCEEREEVFDLVVYRARRKAIVARSAQRIATTEVVHEEL